MTDPFAVVHPPAILSASKALNATLLNCWPRLSDSGHAGQIMRIIVLCWLNLHDNGVVPRPAPAQADAINRELSRTAALLESIWAQRGLDPPGQWAEVLQRKPELAELFPGLTQRLETSAP